MIRILFLFLRINIISNIQYDEKDITYYIVGPAGHDPAGSSGI